MHFSLRSLFADVDRLFPVADGSFKPYINFDNAASTPPFKAAVDAIRDFIPFYSSIHRGTGYKSRVSTELYDYIHHAVLEFVGGDSRQHTVIFGKNATEAINKAACRLPFDTDDIVLVTWLEHHSNILPWLKHIHTKRIRLTPAGGVDLDHLQHLLQKYKGRVKLVAMTAASNVNGLMPDIYTSARLAHEYRAKILVDAAQFIPHRKMNIKPEDHPEHIDFLVFSAHKMYAPFGTGVLVGPKDFFREGDPEYIGGGTVRFVLGKDLIYEDPPAKEEAGSPNLFGVLALWQAIRVYQKIGYQNIQQHEQSLSEYFLKHLTKLPFVRIYGPVSAEPHLRLGVFSFNICGVPHGLAAAVLGSEAGIAVRNGCFCAQPYVSKLLKLSSFEIQSMEKRIQNGNRELPGMVRVSFGMYNTLEEIDHLLFWLRQIWEMKSYYANKYVLCPHTGEYSAGADFDWRNIIPPLNIWAES